MLILKKESILLSASIALNDQPQRLVEGEITPQPVEEYEQTVFHPQNRHQVDKHPNVPGKKAKQGHARQVGHSQMASHGSHRTYSGASPPTFR